MIGEESLQPIGQPLGKSSSCKLSHGSSSNLEISSHGDEQTTEYRIKATDKSGSKPISLWHVSRQQCRLDSSLAIRSCDLNLCRSARIMLHHRTQDVTLVHVDPATDRPTPYLNFVCEIPKFTRKKYEIATDEVGNFIKQDEKKGVLREFKKGDIFFNYGCLPRTWEDPTFVHPDAEGCRGDNDPVE